jgi:hypothetical protein
VRRLRRVYGRVEDLAQHHAQNKEQMGFEARLI